MLNVATLDSKQEKMLNRMDFMYIFGSTSKQLFHLMRYVNKYTRYLNLNATRVDK